MRRPLAALAVALLSLGALALLRGGGAGPPLYDGLCTPPSYRLLGHHPPPPATTTTYTADQLGGTLTAFDDPNSPQAQVIIGAGTLAPAAGASTVAISVTPVPPPATRPNGRIDGNVYDFEATSAGRRVAAAPSHPVTIALGSTSSGSSLTVEHLTGGRWTPLKTFPSGCGSTFDAASPNLGLFALVAPGASSPASPAQQGGGGPLVPIVVVVVLLVLALVIGAVRVGRRRSAGPSG